MTYAGGHEVGARFVFCRFSVISADLSLPWHSPLRLQGIMQSGLNKDNVALRADPPSALPEPRGKARGLDLQMRVLEGEFQPL